ncbi:MAG TPA: hypothetical protein VH044_01375 [Polyangiaceae bacterium]|nr:hypothetical protein [Polyangiaceae bacterium]
MHATDHAPPPSPPQAVSVSAAAVCDALRIAYDFNPADLPEDDGGVPLPWSESMSIEPCASLCPKDTNGCTVPRDFVQAYDDRFVALQQADAGAIFVDGGSPVCPPVANVTVTCTTTYDYL